MIDIKALPKDPVDALISALTIAISKTKGSAQLTTLKSQNHPIFTKLYLACTVIRQCARRLSNQAAAEQIQSTVSPDFDGTLDEFSEHLKIALNIVLAIDIDNHFMSDSEVNEFDRFELDSNEKAEVRGFLSAARQAVFDSDALTKKQKRRVNLRISQAENELYKEVSGFQAFMAAAYEASSLLKQVGEDAAPIAEAIEKARTVTQKSVSGYDQISTDPSPKQIEDKTSNS